MFEPCPFCNDYNTTKKQIFIINVFLQNIIFSKINITFCESCQIEFSTNADMTENHERLKIQKQQLISAFKERYSISVLDGVIFNFSENIQKEKYNEKNKF